MRRSVLRTFWIPLLLFFAASAAWAMTTPLAGSPDESSHIIRAAGVAHGQVMPESFDKDGNGRFTVPASLSEAQTWDDCFAHEHNISAACQQGIAPEPGLAPATSTASNYNPFYYAVVGWPSLLTDNPQVMVYSMRLLTALVSCALLALAYHFLTTIMGVRRAAFVIAATATPMVFFLSAAVNPNGWEIAGGFALLTAALSLGFRRDDAVSDLPALLTIAGAGVLVSNLRGVSPLWVVLLGGIALLTISGPRLTRLMRRPGMWIAIGVIAVGMAVAVLWSLNVSAFALAGAYKGRTWSALQIVDFMVRRTLFEPAYVGHFGWTDTTAPLLSMVLIGGMGVFCVLAAFWLGDRRTILVTSVAIIVWLATPALIQLWYAPVAGMFWQGRYSLLLYAMVVIVSAVTAHDAARVTVVPRALRLTWVLGALVVFGHAYTFVTTQLRFSDGLEGTLIGALVSPAWSPPGGALPWLLMTLAAGLGFAALAAANPSLAYPASTAPPSTARSR